MSKATKELNNLGIENLKKKLEDISLEIVKWETHLRSGTEKRYVNIKDPNLLNRLKKEKARILTIINEKKKKGLLY